MTPPKVLYLRVDDLSSTVPTLAALNPLKKVPGGVEYSDNLPTIQVCRTG